VLPVKKMMSHFCSNRAEQAASQPVPKERKGKVYGTIQGGGNGSCGTNKTAKEGMGSSSLFPCFSQSHAPPFFFLPVASSTPPVNTLMALLSTYLGVRSAIKVVVCLVSSEGFIAAQFPAAIALMTGTRASCGGGGGRGKER